MPVPGTIVMGRTAAIRELSALQTRGAKRPAGASVPDGFAGCQAGRVTLSLTRHAVADRVAVGGAIDLGAEMAALGALFFEPTQQIGDLLDRLVAHAERVVVVGLELVGLERSRHELACVVEYLKLAPRSTASCCVSTSRAIATGLKHRKKASNSSRCAA